MSQSAEEALGSLLEQVRDEWGPEARRVDKVLCALASSRWSSMADLVSSSKTSRRTVGTVLAQFQPFVERQSRVFRLRPEAATFIAQRLRCEQDLAEVGDAAGVTVDDDPHVRTLRRYQEGLPPPVRELDHVLATPESVIRRATFMARRYELGHAHVLCLGDRDLTSLAIALVEPAAKLSVVDIDDRVLEHIAALASRDGLEVETFFCDLRLWLPERLHERMDLVFSDPPYTPEGIQLFLRRGLEGLTKTPSSRLLFCYGYGELQPGLGYRVQEVVHELRLLVEAILPEFNAYVGAEAIGSSSSLYVCRPTRRTWPAVERLGETDSRIYTHGSASVESTSSLLPAEVQELALELVRNAAGGSVSIIGEGWSPAVRAAHDVMPVRDALVAFLTGRPGRATDVGPTTGALVCLSPAFDAHLVRVLLTAPMPLLLVVASQSALSALRLDQADEPIRRALEAQDELRFGAGQSGLAWVERRRRGDESLSGLGFAMAFLRKRPRTKVANALREALVAWCRRQGGSLTKNEARDLIARAQLRPSTLDALLCDLPLHDLRQLVVAIEQCIVHAGVSASANAGQAQPS